eukprot:271100-Pleurochrysis_carterae.AAC.1
MASLKLPSRRGCADLDEPRTSRSRGFDEELRHTRQSPGASRRGAVECPACMCRCHVAPSAHLHLLLVCARPADTAAVRMLETRKSELRPAPPAHRLWRARIVALLEAHRGQQQVVNAHLAADPEVGTQVLALVAPNVEENVPGVERAVELVLEIKAANNHSRAAPPPGPAHS